MLAVREAALRIALIAPHFCLRSAGGGDATGEHAHLAHMARALARCGAAVDVFTRRGHPQQADVVPWLDGVRVVHVPAGPPQAMPPHALPPHMAGFARWAARFAQRQPARYDLAHATCASSGMAALHLKRVLGLPFVLTFHPPGRASGLPSGAAAARTGGPAGIDDSLLRQAARIIAVSPHEIAQRYGIAPARLAVLEHGFAPEELWPVPMPEARRRLDIDPARFIVLQVGDLAPRNGIDTAIQGLAMLRRQHGVDAALIVVGGVQPGRGMHPVDAAGRRDSAELARLRQLARELGVMRQVRFAGRQPRQALRDYYSAADVFAGTPWHGPSGVATVEAMACARPVIATGAGDAEATVLGEVTGYVIPARDPAALAEHLARLRRQPALARAMGDAGRARACDRFTWQHVAGRMLAMYRESLGGQRAVDAARPGREAAAGAPLVAGAVSRNGLEPIPAGGGNRMTMHGERGQGARRPHG